VSKPNKIPVVCPVCGTHFAVEDINNVVCPKCKTPLMLVPLPKGDVRSLTTLSTLSLMHNLNRLYEVLIKKLEKML